MHANAWLERATNRETLSTTKPLSHAMSVMQRDVFALRISAQESFILSFASLYSHARRVWRPPFSTLVGPLDVDSGPIRPHSLDPYRPPHSATFCSSTRAGADRARRHWRPCLGVFQCAGPTFGRSVITGPGGVRASLNSPDVSVSSRMLPLRYRIRPCARGRVSLSHYGTQMMAMGRRPASFRRARVSGSYLYSTPPGPAARCRRS